MANMDNGNCVLAFVRNQRDAFVGGTSPLPLIVLVLYPKPNRMLKHEAASNYQEPEEPYRVEQPEGRHIVRCTSS